MGIVLSKKLVRSVLLRLLLDLPWLSLSWWHSHSAAFNYFLVGASWVGPTIARVSGQFVGSLFGGAFVAHA